MWDSFKSFLMFIMMSIIMIVMIIMSMSSILLIVIIIIVIFFEFIVQNDSFEIIIFITGRFFRFTVGIVVIVVLIIEATVLVKQVNVLGIFDSETFSISELCKYFKSLRIWKMVTLHFVGYSYYEFYNLKWL